MALGELGAGPAGSLLSTGLSKPGAEAGSEAAVPDVWDSRRKLHSQNDGWFLPYFMPLLLVLSRAQAASDIPTPCPRNSRC